MNKKIAEALNKMQQERKAMWELIQFNNSILDVLDEDGYPTEHALKIVEHWPYEMPHAFFEWLKPVWAFSTHEGFYNRDGLTYYISTAGWSGNEAIIEAMKKNSMFWDLNWYSSQRGGHYVFRLYNEQDCEPFKLVGDN